MIAVHQERLFKLVFYSNPPWQAKFPQILVCRNPQHRSLLSHWEAIGSAVFHGTRI